MPDATARDDATERSRRHRKRAAAGLPARRCDATTRAGTRCRLAAGHGTDHPGTGPCSRHGGNLPRVRVAAHRAELLAEARAWAVEHTLNSDEAVLALMRATTAHAVLVERRLRGLRDDDPDVLAWHRTLDAVQRTAAETAAKVVALRLEERRDRMALRQADFITRAAQQGLNALATALGGAPLPPDAVTAFRDAYVGVLEAVETTGADDLPQLPAPSINGGPT